MVDALISKTRNRAARSGRRQVRVHGDRIQAYVLISSHGADTTEEERDG